MHRPIASIKFRPERENVSLLFRAVLFLLGLLRRPYLWTRAKWPHYFEKRLDPEANLDTSRMLPKFNWLHRRFFGRGFEKIRFNQEDLKNLEEARQKGPVVLLMRNWGQVEYNYFNFLFLQEKLPLVTHNNMVKMTHWMPTKIRRAILFRKLDLFFTARSWPFNNQIFSLSQGLQEGEAVLYCLDLPKGGHWVERTLSSQEKIITELMEAQKKVEGPIQLIPLYFIYDKHPGSNRKTLGEIVFGQRDHPAYLRKVILFLRNYKKRAVAKIGDPLDLKSLRQSTSGPTQILKTLQRTFEQETQQVTGPKLKSRRRMMTEIRDNPRVQEKLKKMAATQKLSVEVGEKKLHDYLQEITSDLSFTMVELWNYFLSWLFNRFYEGLHVDKAGLARIKKVAKDSPLVLVPSHKSHIDYLMLSYVFYNHDLSLPHVCAGKNLNFWPLGKLFRRSGAYFIRRSFSGNQLYGLALKSYVGQLMQDGFFQEFFIEGTRSRSGKLFPPKLGLLSMMVETFLENEGLKDVYFVPVAIDYERILEEGSYLEEVKGAQKKGERLRDLFHLPKFLKKHYGKVYVQFAEPISLKEKLQGQEDPSIRDREVRKEFNQELSQEIARAINKVTTLLPSSLVAAALLTPKTPSLTSKEIHQKCEDLFAVLGQDEARLSEALEKNIHHGVQEALDNFVHDGLIHVHPGLEEKFYTLPEESRISLDFYRNGAMHVLAPKALRQLCENRSQSGFPGGTENLFKNTRQLLAREFFFSEAGLKPTPPSSPPWLWENLLPVLEAYWLTLKSTQEIPFKKMEEWLLIRKILERGRLLNLRGDLKYPESLSRFNIQNALHQLVQMGVLKNHFHEMGPKGRKYYSPGPSAQKREEVETLLKPLLER